MACRIALLDPPIRSIPMTVGAYDLAFLDLLEHTGPVAIAKILPDGEELVLLVVEL